jgi:hypothetical protein
MSEIDLSAAVETVARVRYETATHRLPEAKPFHEHPMVESDWRPEARRIVSAIAPLIEAAVREQIARGIEAELDRDDAQKSTDFSEGLWSGLNNARHIARGDS